MNFASIKPHIKPSIMLAWPVMLSQLGHVLMGITDNVMIGHVGATPLAAAALANVAFNVLLFFGVGVSYAITPLVAAAAGDKNDGQIVAVFRHGLVINLINSLILSTVVVSVRNFLYHIGQPPEVVDLAIPYLSIITFSIVPVLIFQTFRQFAEGLSNTSLAMIVVLGSNVLHVGLNYVFIYGYDRFPAMGLVGAGWATLASRILMAAAIAGYVYLAPRYRRYRDAFLWRDYSRKLFSKMLNIGLPAGAQFIFEAAAFDFSAVMMGWLGTATLAAHQIAINLATISYMTTSGLGAAATIRVSTELGRRDYGAMRVVAQTLILMAMAFMTAWMILFIAGRNFLPSLYIRNTEVLTIAAPLVVIAGFFQLADGLQVVCAGALRGLQDVKMPSLFIFIAYWVIGLPLGYGFAFWLGLGGIGIWIGLLTGLTLTAAAMLLRFLWLSKKSTKLDALSSSV